MTPPHLPAKTENPETKKFFQRLKWILFIVVLSVSAGTSGASMMLGWIWPRFAEGDTWINSYTRPGLSRGQLESLIREDVAARVLHIYRGSTAIGSVQYLNKKLGDGIILSSDGWVAFYQPDYDGVYKNLSITDNNDHVYTVDRALWDKQSGFLYIKVKNSQFNKAVEFADDVSAVDDIFILQDENWYHTNILYPVLSSKVPHTDTAPIREYSLGSNFTAGSLAVNNQGRVVGFISEKNTLVPATTITRILERFLSRQVLTYPSLGVDGWFSDEQVIVNTQNQNSPEQLQGFFVSGVWSSGSQLRKGDVITEINNRVVTADNLWYTVSNATSVKAKIFRGGKIIDVDVKIVQTK